MLTRVYDDSPVRLHAARRSSWFFLSQGWVVLRLFSSLSPKGKLVEKRAKYHVLFRYCHQNALPSGSWHKQILRVGVQIKTVLERGLCQRP